MRPPRSVHPRVRGEQQSSASATAESSGSSPRARGTGCVAPWCWQRPRFIPACAGNRRESSASTRPIAVHPRVRGEQRNRFAAGTASSGSSPRARGTGGRARCMGTALRFIPACAGNRNCARWIGERIAVHPRVRGEQIPSAWQACLKYGSSPRARGTGSGARGVAAQQRFIPACAGNSMICSAMPSTSTVHPRVRGEQRSEQ